MGKIGFIGFGAMGSIIVKALLDVKAIPENKVILTTRTPEKLKDFTARHPKVEVVGNITELAKKSERVFICTGTKEMKSVVTEMAQYLPEDAHVVYIAGTIEMKCMESIYKGKISHLMPTQIAEVGEGVTMVCHNSKVLPGDREFIASTFGKIGKVKEIPESWFSLAANLASCAPGFYAAILRNFGEVAKKYGDLPPEEINEIIIATIYGTAKLLLKYGVGFGDLIRRVATKGGITEEGVKVLDRALPDIWDEVLSVTLKKREIIKAQMREQYGLK